MLGGIGTQNFSRQCGDFCLSPQRTHFPPTLETMKDWGYFLLGTIEFNPLVQSFESWETLCGEVPEAVLQIWSLYLKKTATPRVPDTHGSIPIIAYGDH